MIRSDDEDLVVLSNRLNKIRILFSEEKLLQITIWRRTYGASELKLLYLFDQFTDLEQSIMRLLALGASLEQISSIKSVGVAPIRHAISIIRENDVWKEINGPKD